LACRRIAAENPDKRWLHWIHSATTPNILLDVLKLNGEAKDIYMPFLKKPFVNSFIVFPNEYSIPRVATNFGVEIDRVKYVHHPMDIVRYYGMHNITKGMVERYDLLNADVIDVYPARLDRGKNLEVPIEIMAQIKKMGRTVKMIVVDFHSTGGDKVTYRNSLKDLAISKGLIVDGDERDLIFTSEYSPDTAARCPREVVRDLFTLSNVFIMPSRSESYSLITQEAAMSGNVLMLNRDFPPFIDIFGQAPYYGQFSSNIDALSGMDGDTNTDYGNRDNYMRDMAGRLLYELSNNKVIRMKDLIRKTRNLKYVFRNQLEPLLYYKEK
jgi:hypothetical protein